MSAHSLTLCNDADGISIQVYIIEVPKERLFRREAQAIQ